MAVREFTPYIVLVMALPTGNAIHEDLTIHQPAKPLSP